MTLRCMRCGETWREPKTWLGRWWRRLNGGPEPGGSHWYTGGSYSPVHFDLPGWCGPVLSPDSPGFAWPPIPRKLPPPPPPPEPA